MNYFKVIFLIAILGSHPKSLYANIENVMDFVDAGEDFFLEISEKFKTFLCGTKPREMKTSIGSGINILLCKDGQSDFSSQKIALPSLTIPNLEPSLPAPEEMEFVVIEAGEFKMGSPGEEKGRQKNEEQVHVRITRPFEIMAKEVTQSQWVAVMKDNPSRFKSSKYCPDDYIIGSTELKDLVSLCPNHPVEMVSSTMIQKFIDMLNKNRVDCHHSPRDSSGCYRLPTEAEWEYAARGGTETAYSFDMDLIDFYAWYDKNSNKQTHRVGLMNPNPFYLYDMNGNVWELVQDVYSKKLPGGDDPVMIFKSSHRVIRGGSWKSKPSLLRSAHRISHWGRQYFVGFRLAKTL